MCEAIELQVTRIVHLLEDYGWLLDCYVIEFFTEDHWSKLPSSWQHHLSLTSLPSFCQQLLRLPLVASDQDSTRASARVVLPLTLLALAAAARNLSCQRQPGRRCTHMDSHQPILHRSESAVSNGHQMTRHFGGIPSQIPGLDHSFRRHVKPKKQHEIKRLGEVIHALCQQTGCSSIIDVGCGQGHLARYLAFHHGLHVTAVEAVQCHLTTATKYDKQVSDDQLKAARRKGEKSIFSTGSIRYVESMVEPDVTPSDFLELVSLATDEDTSSSAAQRTVDEKHILVGLHTCGDLASSILRIFASCRQLVGLVLVGCCYMKLTHHGSMMREANQHRDFLHSKDNSLPSRSLNASPISMELERVNTAIASTVPGQLTDKECGITTTPKRMSHKALPSPPPSFTGYPLSQFVRSLPRHGLSYKAREVACHSMEIYVQRLTDSSEYLKIHCYRAAVETILRKNGLRRPCVKISRSISKQPLESYALSICELVGISPSNGDLTSVCQLTSAYWQQVVMFFLLRLVLAPCVETLLLLDRILFLREEGCSAVLQPVFDPLLSPRNLVITAKKGA